MNTPTVVKVFLEWHISFSWLQREWNRDDRLIFPDDDTIWSDRKVQSDSNGLSFSLGIPLGVKVICNCGNDVV